LFSHPIDALIHVEGKNCAEMEQEFLMVVTLAAWIELLVAINQERRSFLLEAKNCNPFRTLSC